MPLLNSQKLQESTLPIGHYGYSATRIEELGATEYTLVTIVCDASGSVAAFRTELEQALQRIVQACQLSPRADNLMLRLVEFNNAMHEIHGFKLLATCRLEDYADALHLGGNTALYDAAENAVSATTDYARRLAGAHFAANAIVFVITDGMDNASRMTPKAVKQAIDKAVVAEELESVVSVLIGVNVADPGVRNYLQKLKTDAGFMQYVEIGSADVAILARLAEFVTRSISLQSSALGTGGPSRSLTF